MLGVKGTGVVVKRPVRLAGSFGDFDLTALVVEPVQLGQGAMPLTLGILAGQDPESDLRAGWQRFLVVVGLAWVAAAGLSLFAG
jgi:hypothetical protein